VRIVVATKRRANPLKPHSRKKKKVLLALRADASIKDKRGRTASDVARCLSHLKVCVCVCVCVFVCVCVCACVRARAYCRGL
jgi:hypothetical protein